MLSLETVPTRSLHESSGVEPEGAHPWIVKNGICWGRLGGSVG